MKLNVLDKNLLNRSELRSLLERLVLKHRHSHRWLSSPVVKNIELAKLTFNDSFFLDFVLKKMAVNEIEFHPFKKIIIQQNEKSREIYVQNWADKIIQIRIQEIINKIIQTSISGNVYSFQKGKGPIHAIQDFLSFSRKYKTDIFVLQLDISKYGDNIDQEILRQMLHEKLSIEHHPLMGKHLDKILNFEIIDTDGQRVRKDKGIATGSPLVPLFENLYLLPVDKFIASIRPLYYARYGDDMVVAFESLDRVESSLLRITEEINKLKLCIHPEKIKITKLSDDTSFDWLGFKVTGKKQTGSKKAHVTKIMKDIKNEIHKHFFLLRQIHMTSPCIKELTKSLESLEKKIYRKYSNRIFNFYTSDDETKLIDEFRIKETHKAICRNFRIDKRIAWKIIRQIRHKSANQTRMHFLRKKQWPKVPLKN